MKPSTDYHDYFLKNGKFIGKFEQMYKYSKEIPWHQDEMAYSVISDIDMTILRQFKYESICEIGCGLGYFSNRLQKELSFNEEKPTVVGVDLSYTAIKKARNLFPEISFIKGDLLKKRPLSGKYFKLVIIKEILWYVCHRLTQFLQNVMDMIKDDGFLYVSQSFPEVDKWMGQEVIDGPETLKEILIQYAKQ